MSSPAEPVVVGESAARVGFGARTPWSAGGAIVFAVLSLLLASAAAFGAIRLYFQIVKTISPTAGIEMAAQHITQTNTMFAMAAMQTVMIVLVLWAAGRFGGVRRAVLSLPGGLPIGEFLLGLAGMALILLPYNLLIYWLSPDRYFNDLRLFADLARSPAAWIAALVVTIGAPLSEELLFRGFLLPAIVKTQLGLAGGVVLASAGWTAMHAGYSPLGLLEVFLIGLYFGWLVLRTGNVWLPMALHAFYNGLQFAVLAQWPLPGSS